MGNLARLMAARLNLLAGVVDVVPGHIEEDGLDGDHCLSRGEFHDAVEISPTDRILLQLLHEGKVAFVFDSLGLPLAQVVDVDNGAVALQLAINHSFNEFKGGRGDIEAQGELIGNGLLVRQLFHGL